MTGGLLSQNEKLTVGVSNTQAASDLDNKHKGGAYAPGFNPPDDLD